MKLRVIILFAIVGTAACHRDAGNAPAAPVRPKAGAQTGAANQRGANPQELTAGMVEAVGQGRAQVPIDLKFDLLQRPVQGQPLEIAVALLPQTAAESATVEVTGSDGLKVEAAEQQFSFPGIEAAQVYRHSIKVTPTGEGFYMLTLSVSLQHQQTTDSRVFSVPILVGSAVGAASPPPGGAPGAAQQAAGAHRGS
jgi:hypothetical protein